MLSVSLERLNRRLNQLAGLTRPELPYTRRAFTPLYQQARAWLAAEFRAAGLEPLIDAGGNLVGRREGRHPGALVLGSHTDTVRAGGRFDGILGVLAALEVAQTVHQAGVALEHSLEVVDFLSEEPSDYAGLSCVGSRSWAGTLSEAMLGYTDPQGETLGQAMTRVGADLERVRLGPVRRAGELAAYLELHIEQGPALESAGVPIGVVTGIAGIERWSFAVTGQADHAGTTPMHMRRDALVGASQLALELHRRAREIPALVATFGTLELSPNAANIVPARIQLVSDVRSTDPELLTRFCADFADFARSSCEALGLSLEAGRVSRSQPTGCDPRLQAAIQAGAARRGHASMALPSGAGHDGAHLAALCPVGMVFVPSVGGRSHTPEEFTFERDLLAGTETLLEALLILDRTLG